MYYVFDALEIIMGPYDTHKEAEWWLTAMVDGCNLLDDYPNPHIDYLECDEECPPITRERIIKRKKVNE